MGSDDYLVTFEKYAVGHRLVDKDINSSASYFACLNRLEQGFFIDKPAAGAVDDAYCRLYLTQLLGTNHPFGIRSQWQMQGNKVSFLKQLLHGNQLHSQIMSIIRRDERVITNEAHFKSLSSPGHLRADIA